MIFSTKSQIFATLIAIGVLVLLLLAPTKSSIAPEKEAITENGLQEAVELVSSGKDPMKGIMMLREILKENPKDVEAHFYLGVFSIQSGQYDKALNRLNKVLSIDSEFYDAYLYLGYANEALGKKEEAIISFETFKKNSTNEELLKEVEKHIYELKNN